MNLVAATLLLIYEDEERAYWTFVCLIRNLLPQEWFTRTLQGSMAEQAVLAELVAEHLPKIDRHFSEIGLDLSAVTFGWMLSLFTSCLPIEVGGGTLGSQSKSIVLILCDPFAHRPCSASGIVS